VKNRCISPLRPFVQYDPGEPVPEKQSLTRTNFLHFLLSVASSLHSCLVWQSFSVTLLHRPAGDVNHKRSSRLPLLSARSAVTLSVSEFHRPWPVAIYIAWWTDARACEQLALRDWRTARDQTSDLSSTSPVPFLLHHDPTRMHIHAWCQINVLWLFFGCCF